LGNFIEAFIQKNDLPPISADGKTGGVAVLGWSAGGLLSCAVIANIDSLSPTAKDRFKLYLRAHILQGLSIPILHMRRLNMYPEPPSIALGLPLPASNWSPHMSPTIPADKHSAMFTSWITSYFDHGDLSTRDVSVLSYHVPSPFADPPSTT
jgi:hypothetical protein